MILIIVAYIQVDLVFLLLSGPSHTRSNIRQSFWDISAFKHPDKQELLDISEVVSGSVNINHKRCFSKIYGHFLNVF